MTSYKIAPITFAQVSKGECFECGGNLYRKRSSRTAEIVATRQCNGLASVHRRYAGVWGYFSNPDRVNHNLSDFQPCVRRFAASGKAIHRKINLNAVNFAVKKLEQALSYTPLSEALSYTPLSEALS